MIRKIDLMHKLFGEIPGMSCKDCSHLVTHKASHRWYKCECYGETSSEATDWRLKYTACGLYSKEYNGTPVVRFVRPEKKPEKQIEGQMSLFEGNTLCKKRSSQKDIVK